MPPVSDSDLMDEDVHTANLLGLRPAGPSDDIFAQDMLPLSAGLSLHDDPFVMPPESSAEPAQGPAAEAQVKDEDDTGPAADREHDAEPAGTANAEPPGDSAGDGEGSASTSYQNGTQPEQHRIPYSMGHQELERLRMVLLKALGSVREPVRQALSDRGVDVSEDAQQLLMKRAQLVLYYMRVHEVSQELLKELHLVELVHMVQREPGLEALSASCATLLRCGNWGRRSALVGLHPDAPQNAVPALSLPPQNQQHPGAVGAAAPLQRTQPAAPIRAFPM